jgi:tRNA pseudouridine55 synthase
VGVYVVNKPLGLTSHDVVGRARRLLNTRRIGHTGTLDPLATGVLVLAVDDSTKLVQFMESHSKSYLAFVSFGASTPTLDAEGPVLETAETRLTLKQIEHALEGLRGAQQQVPPAYSAIHVNGKRAYDLARGGQTVDLPARAVTIHDLKLLRLEASMHAFSAFGYGVLEDETWGVTASGARFAFPAPLGAFQTVLLHASVSAGTYLRSLARDLGVALGVPAHLAGLVRTRVGRFTLGQSTALEAIASARPVPDLEALDLPQVAVDSATARALRDGKRVSHPLEGRAMIVTAEKALVAVVDGDGSSLRVVRAWQ